MLTAWLLKNRQVLGILEVWVVSPVASKTDAVCTGFLRVLRGNGLRNFKPVFAQILEGCHESLMLLQDPDVYALTPHAGHATLGDLH